MRSFIKLFSLSGLIILLASCVSTIRHIGTVGPKKLCVYTISDTDFFSANRMLIVLNEKGNIAAYTGGTVSGLGTVGLQAATSVANSGAILLGAKAIQTGIQNAHLKVKGIPSNVKIDANIIPKLPDDVKHINFQK